MGIKALLVQESFEMYAGLQVYSNPEYTYLASLADQLRRIKCVVNTKSIERGGDAHISVTYSKYPIRCCLRHLGWGYGKGTGTFKEYVRPDGSWPLEVYWQGSTFITIKPGYVNKE